MGFFHKSFFSVRLYSTDTQTVDNLKKYHENLLNTLSTAITLRTLSNAMDQNGTFLINQ